MIYFILCSIVAFAAMVILQNVKAKNVKLKVRKDRFEQFKNYLTERVDEKSVDKMLISSGLRISAYQYQLFRYVMVFVFAIFTLISFLLNGGVFPDRQLMLILSIFLLATPKTSILGKPTPFVLITGSLTKGFRYRKNLEIYRAISQLKNIAIAKEKNPPGAEFILEQLKKFSSTTRPIFNKTISLWNLGKKEEACNYFANEIGTNEGKELANILLKLDDLTPSEIRKQLELFQEIIMRERGTNKLKQNENKSNLVYIFVVVSSVIVLLNFVVVAYYIDFINLIKFK